MKKQLFFTAAGIISLLFINIYCTTNSGPNLSGYWKGNQPSVTGPSFLNITQKGDNYTIIAKLGDFSPATYYGKYVNGTIEVGGGILGNPVYSGDTKKISWTGIVFTKTEVPNNQGN